MTLLICSLALNVVLFFSVIKACNRADAAEYDAKMYKDDKNYWMNRAYRNETTNRNKIKGASEKSGR